MFGNLLGRASHDNFAAARAGFWPKIDNVIRLGDHTEIVLDHDHGVPFVHQAVEHVEKQFNVGHVQANGRFLQQIQCRSRLTHFSDPLIRRATQAPEPTRLSAGDLTMDLLTREVKRGAQTIELQPREFALLEYLMRHANRPVTKTMILEHIWHYHFHPQTNVVDVLVCRVRAKVDREFLGKMIHTVRGMGYVLRIP